MRKTGIALLILMAAGCAPLPDTAGTPMPALPMPAAGPALSPAAARAAFNTARARVEPVAESLCRQRTQGVNCDFQISIDDSQGNVANAYQSRDASGRPVIRFTTALVNDARNTDELAFVLGHEAAHHILGHIDRQTQTATAGALLGGIVASLGGFDPDTLTDVGAGLGGRVYSKSHELEADRLGTRIAIAAGYDPVKGIGFFQRLPDPGDRFLGTHPANGDRIAAVRAEAAQGGRGF
ncbi:M48 family metallopeptidase [Falsirhodobacter algicola]|uniref:M48 family metalloprotease n=1 Tax=Falsirhodobacter algicola TaxID=2692330 RepID=A0A8J8MRY2_9RHOB|nr:M48 family metallopeptidase [Falsirhodobacter algicola]QUS35198.1 M48 family metalloprotease [Falsirhodobacter algicola]